MPPQQATIGLALIERIERTNTVVVREQGVEQGAGVPPRWDPYAMEVDKGRNCYAYENFEHMARYCRNRGKGRPIEERRVQYEEERIKEIIEQSNNLKGGENLEFLNYILSINIVY